MLFEDFLAEGVVVAEDVFDVPEDPISGKRKSSDAREEVNVRDFFIRRMTHLLIVA